MKKASEYRAHAEQCRALARSVRSAAQRGQLLAMAETWDKLADDRSRFVQRYPELAHEGDRLQAEFQTPSGEEHS